MFDVLVRAAFRERDWGYLARNCRLRKGALVYKGDQVMPWMEVDGISCSLFTGNRIADMTSFCVRRPVRGGRIRGKFCRHGPDGVLDLGDCRFWLRITSSLIADILAFDDRSIQP